MQNVVEFPVIVEGDAITLRLNHDSPDYVHVAVDEHEGPIMTDMGPSIVFNSVH